ncbi:MAG: glycosyltransferase [Anaerolineales bacterium]
MPKVTVLMAVRNGMPYLAGAIDSVLRQTFDEFEFVIIEDASTDDSRKVLNSYSDKRLRLVFNRKQLGLSRSLNKGLDIASGQYIARMDHDDISLPRRLKTQYSFMEEHPDIDVLGCWAKTIGGKPEQTWKYPERDEDIRSEFIFNSSVVHSSVMLRRSTFERLQLRYDEKVVRAQDYELWTRASPRVRFANLQSVLLRYRLHSHQVGRQYGHEQQAVADQVRLRELYRLGLNPTAVEKKIHNRTALWDFPNTSAGLQAMERWFLKLAAANKRKQIYIPSALSRTLERRWWGACRVNIDLGLLAWKRYARSPLSGFAAINVFEKIYFRIKALTREGSRKRI